VSIGNVYDPTGTAAPAAPATNPAGAKGYRAVATRSDGSASLGEDSVELSKASQGYMRIADKIQSVMADAGANPLDKHDERPKGSEAEADDAQSTDSDEQKAAEQEGAGKKAGSAPAGDSTGADGLTKEEQAEVTKLRARDTEVRAHEMAHKAAAGSLAPGAVHYDYQTGPDNRRYAVGGHVAIALSSGRTPQESLRLAEQAQRAALAPAKPSSSDRAVAAEASRQATEARAKIAEERMEDQSPEESHGAEPSGSDSDTGETDAPEDPEVRTHRRMVEPSEL